MNNYNDDWLANRITKQVNSHHLSDEVLRFWSEGATQFPVPLWNFGLTGEVGIPVFAIIESTARWTILGTRAIASHDSDEIVVAELDRVTACDSPTRNVQPKGDHDYLHLTMDDERVVPIWSAPGATFYALWNVMVMLIRLKEKTG